MQTFGIVCMKWYSPKQGVFKRLSQRVWSLIPYAILVFDLGYLISSFTHSIN
jgi:hypothetical protein